MSLSPPLLSKFQYLERTGPGRPALADAEGEIHLRLQSLGLPAGQWRNRRIAVAVGSRGIASLSAVIRATCDWLKSQGASPFVFPAMGSHGGATAAGQREVLAGYGITPETMGAKIISSMETVSLGSSAHGLEVFMDRNAWESDGVLLVNRVKPHTAFSGKIESGLVKMAAVGMGKKKGAEEIHRGCRRFGYETAIRSVAEHVLAKGKVIAGLALVENEMHQLCLAEALGAQDIISSEEKVLALAKQLVARIPFNRIEILIVDEMGKNVSGSGMDTKVIGRGVECMPGEAPEIRLIYVRDLTDESGGNALGVGLADLIHEQLFRKVDFNKTYVNVRTSLNQQMARIPMYFESDRSALTFALGALGSPHPAAQRIVRIRNTLCLDRLAISTALAAEAAELKGWRISQQTQAEFDREESLKPLESS